MRSVQIEVRLDVGPDDPPTLRTLHVISLQGREQIGQPYRYALEVVTAWSTPLDDDVVSAPAKIEIVENGYVKRTLRGTVISLESSMEPGVLEYRQYRLEVVPTLGELERFVAQDVYVEKTYPEVIGAKLALAGFQKGVDLELRLEDPAAYGDTPWKDGDPDAQLAQGRLVVQYRESDLAFVSRLAEHVGISYFFEDAGDAEKLVFTDHVDGFKAHDGAVIFGGTGEDHGIVSMRRRKRAVASAFYVYDYNYRTPLKHYEKDGARVFDVVGGEAHVDGSPGAHVEYAPNAKTESEAAFLARIRAQAEASTQERYSAMAQLVTLYPGVRFHLDNHPELDASDDELLVVGSTVTFEGTAPFGTVGAKRSRYSVELDLFRTRRQEAEDRPFPYRPPRLTPRPRIHGVVTGTIQSPVEPQSSNMQYIDAQGRYLVKLHFDQTPSVFPRVRMAQPHAGEGYGHHFPLRPGTEVLVAFVDGDPDRPVIMGAVPNPVKPSPVVAPRDGEPIEISRIESRSGIRIEFSDGPKG
jgi:type VI secretion system secreted protein VgrG